MRVLIIVIAFLACETVQAQAQSEVFLQQAGVSIGSGSGNIDETGRIQLLRSLVPLAVSPEANVVVVEQEGQDNSVKLEQSGTGNRFLLSQSGSNLGAEFLQRGAGNEATLVLIGQNNTIRGGQQGNANSYVLSLTSSNTTHTVQQIGVGNQAQQVVAPGMVPASIEQRGNGAQVLVERR